MAKEINRPERIFRKLKSDLIDDAGLERVKRGFMKPRELTMPKMTELVTRTMSWRNVLEELKTKPEKKK